MLQASLSLTHNIHASFTALVNLYTLGTRVTLSLDRKYTNSMAKVRLKREELPLNFASPPLLQPCNRRVPGLSQKNLGRLVEQAWGRRCKGS